MADENSLVTEQRSCWQFSRKKCFTIIVFIFLVQLPIFYFLYKSEYRFDHVGFNDIFIKSSKSSNLQPEHVHKVTSALNRTNTVKNETSVSVGTKNLSTVKQVAIVTSQPANAQDTNKCGNPPPKLVGLLAINFEHEAPSFETTYKKNNDLLVGGHFIPDCEPLWRVAIIIPFRKRDEHLKYFLEYMHPIFRRQLIEYQIFIINQAKPEKFNRAMLLNVGFSEALKVNGKFDCFSFHDVDLIIQNDRNLYYCSDRPRHLAAYVDKFKYTLPYGSIFGGATLFRRQDFELVNGHSNRYWGWGGEDDDLFNRVRSKGLKIIRYSKDIAKYKMISHKREKGNEPNPKRFKMITQTKLEMVNDGLSSLTYEVLRIELHPTYTNITVDLGLQP